MNNILIPIKSCSLDKQRFHQGSSDPSCLNTSRQHQVSQKESPTKHTKSSLLPRPINKSFGVPVGIRQQSLDRIVVKGCSVANSHLTSLDRLRLSPTSNAIGNKKLVRRMLMDFLQSNLGSTPNSLSIQKVSSVERTVDISRKSQKFKIRNKYVTQKYMHPPIQTTKRDLKSKINGKPEEQIKQITGWKTYDAGPCMS